MIKNEETLVNIEKDPLIKRGRKLLLELIATGIQAADPFKAVQKHVKLEGRTIRIATKWERDISSFENIIIVGAGKASAKMALALEKILGEENITKGLVNVPSETVSNLTGTSKIRFHPAGHPVATKASLEGTKEIIKLISGLTRNDLVICVISGGGSAMLELPIAGITLNHFSTVFNLLTQKGATIYELNAFRKHLSQVKGGRLAKIARPAEVVSLIISDVVGDDLSTIASGPTTPDKTSWHDLMTIMKKYALTAALPQTVIQLIEKGVKRELAETLRATDPVFMRVHNFLIASNTLSCHAIKQAALGKGFTARIVSTTLTGEARLVGEKLAEELLHSEKNNVLIAGGETTVTITGKGIGGRNQELALAAATHLSNKEGIFFAAVGSDGKDGPTDAAGAIIDYQTILKGVKKGLRAETFLLDNNSYAFLKETNSLILTGPTGTNVSDLFLGVHLARKAEQKSSRIYFQSFK
ncbi:MAG: glycerate kinase type-2 family protein [Candidatus Heimdallarchaeota archaeon]